MGSITTPMHVCMLAGSGLKETLTITLHVSVSCYQYLTETLHINFMYIVDLLQALLWSAWNLCVHVHVRVA